MYKNISLFILFLTLTQLACSAQNRVEFIYDDAGNRTERHFIDLNPSKSTLLSDKDGWQKAFDDKILGTEIKIYPNPTKGMIKIDLKNYEGASKGEIRVYDVTGKIVYQNNQVSTSNIVSLEHLRNGAYILKLVIEDNATEWKILKQ
jgi:hypothetical protein